MLEWLMEPWPWYISGPLIGLTVPLLLLLTGKNFGISSSLRHIGAACAPNSKLPYLSKNYNWRDHIPSIIFVIGVVIGGFIVGRYPVSVTTSLILRSMVVLVIFGMLCGFRLVSCSISLSIFTVFLKQSVV